MQLLHHPHNLHQACHRLHRPAAAAIQRVALPSSWPCRQTAPAAAAVAPSAAVMLVPRSRTRQQQVTPQQRQWQLLPAAAAAAPSSSSGAEPGQQPPAENVEPSTLALPAAVEAASSSSSGDAAGQQPPAAEPEASKPKGGLMTWFDRLPAQTQLGVMGGLLFLAAVVGPFLQPTWMYGSSISAPGNGQITEAQQASQQRYQLPRYIPVASELYDFLQDNAMPTVLPDGRSESPGVLRIYMCSMIILCVFYVCSAVVSLILRGVAGVLRAVGVMGPAPPPPKPEEQS